MKIYFLILCTTFICFVGKAQNTLTKLKFEEAEKAFYDSDYENCIKLLDETEKLLGQPAPKILHLKIMAENKIWEANPYASYGQLERLRSLCNQYMQNYDIQGLEDKFKEVYTIYNTLPVDIEDFEKKKVQHFNEIETKKKLKAISNNNMVLVKGGTFTMGQKKEAHEVTVSDFYIGKYEITVNDYKKFIEENPNYKIRELVCDDCPIGEVSWQEAMDYCKWLEKKHGGIWRLPTEAEWEYAAIGGIHYTPETYSNLKYCDVDVHQSVKNNGYKTANIYGGTLIKNKQIPVDSYLPNQLGLFNMVGNVKEWCYDWYDANYQINGPKKNPIGPDKGSFRVIKGISWRSGSSICDLSFTLKRDFSKHEYGNDIGFRVVYIPDKD